LVRRFRRVTFNHVRREFNAHADRLANEAMDAAAAGREWSRSEVPEPTPEAADAKESAYGWVAPTGTPTTMLLLRHGETELSIDKRFSGRGDVALTERGLAQARSAAKRLTSYDVAAVVSSPLRRARQTADEVADVLGLKVEEEPAFVETDFGEWEGLTFGEVRRQWPEQMRQWLASPDVAPVGGESFTATFERVRRGRDALIAAHPNETVVVVSHVTPIKTLLRQALDAPAHSLYRIYLDLASLSVTDWWSDGPAVVRLLNDTGHLGDDLVTRGR
jgi:probable phosphoglycerate mutase